MTLWFLWNHLIHGHILISSWHCVKPRNIQFWKCINLPKQTMPEFHDRFFFFASLRSKYLLLEFIVYLFLLCNGPYCLGGLPLHFFPSYCSVDRNCWCFPLLESHIIKSSLSQIAISKTRHSAADEAFPKLCEKQIWCSMSCRLQTRSGISVQLSSFLPQMILLNCIQHWSNSGPFPRLFPSGLWSQLFSHPVFV